MGGTRFTEDRFAGGYAVETSEAPLERIALSLGRLAGCRVEVDPKVKERRLTLDLVARPMERLFLVLARRAGVRISVRYRFEPLPAGEARRRGAGLFAGKPLELEIREPAPLEEALQRLDVRFDVDRRMRATVRVRAVRHPLSAVLDSLAEQAGAKWQTVVRFEERLASDGEGAAYERIQSHFFELARLPEAERREEVRADLEAIEKLPEDRRPGALERTAQDVLSMESYLHNDSSERRGPVWDYVYAVSLDYWTVLHRMPAARREAFAPVIGALVELRRRVERIRDSQE